MAWVRLRVQIPASPFLFVKKSMKKINQLIELVKKCRENCPWCKEQTVETFLKHVISEAEELKEALKSKNKEDIKGEIGDLVWDSIMLLHVAKHMGIEPDDVIDSVNKKMMRRKPYIVTGQKVTIQEDEQIWKEAKEQEKKKRILF